MDHSEFQTYKDIQARTNGEIYIGVVGPVRTGKSTFIRRFMDLLVLPHMDDVNERERTKDELPQAGSGKTITTTEPKFIPKEAAQISLDGDVNVRVRLVDCVGYMVNGATGHTEGAEERKVKTPWDDREIPFTQAATIGTRKVIRDHSTVGIVVTTDGSIGELPREAYRQAEEQTIRELQELKKPFVVLVNSRKPYSEEAKQTVLDLQEQYQVTALPVNCEQLQENDIHRIMEQLLYSFPITEIRFFLPGWVEMLPSEHEIRTSVASEARKILDSFDYIKDVTDWTADTESPYIESVQMEKIDMDTGVIQMAFRIFAHYYYEILSQMTEMEIQDEADLIRTIRLLAEMKKSYAQVKDALDAVRGRGYGVVIPNRSEIRLEEPAVVKQGNKYGVKIHAEAPSIHMIRADIQTEIAPLVGTEKQAEDLVAYIRDSASNEEGIWNTNIFGKSVEDLVTEGIRSKITMINDSSQVKLQDTMKKIVNDSNGGIVCIII
jgi:stage IV sporulation protein A